VWSSNCISSLQIDSDCAWQHGQEALILHIDLKKAEASAGCNDESSNKLEQEAAMKDSRLRERGSRSGVGTNLLRTALTSSYNENYDMTLYFARQVIEKQ